MAVNDYHFITHWRVDGDIETVSDILSDPLDLPRWWPAVYLEAEELEPPTAENVGQVISLYTKGWLPYTLRWAFRVTENNAPQGFALEANGDFVGRGVWTLVQNGQMVDITFDWRIRAKKTLLKLGTPFLKPMFAANHRWAMAMGEASLRLELARRAAPNEAARAGVPAPPGPTPTGSLAWLGAVIRTR